MSYRALLVVLASLLAAPAGAVTLRPGDLVGTQGGSFVRVDPANGAVAPIPVNWDGVVGDPEGIEDLVVSAGGVVYVTTHFYDPSTDQSADGVGILDVKTGAITPLVDGSGHSIALWQGSSDSFDSFLDVDNAGNRLVVGRGSNIFRIDLQGGNVASATPIGSSYDVLDITFAGGNLAAVTIDNIYQEIPTVDLGGGGTGQLVPTSPDFSSYVPEGIAGLDASGHLLVNLVTNGNAAAQGLFAVDLATGAATRVANVPTTTHISLVSSDGGTAYGVDSSGELVEIDLATGATHVIQSTATVALRAYVPLTVPEPLIVVLLGISGVCLSRRRG